MKKPICLSLLLAIGIVGCATENKALQREAKVSKADAEAAALAKVPGATVKECELEKENGRVIWSVELKSPGSNAITEVNVDAVSGQIVNIEHEKGQ